MDKDSDSESDPDSEEMENGIDAKNTMNQRKLLQDAQN